MLALRIVLLSIFHMSASSLRCHEPFDNIKEPKLVSIGSQDTEELNLDLVIDYSGSQNNLVHTSYVLDPYSTLPVEFFLKSFTEIQFELPLNVEFQRVISAKEGILVFIYEHSKLSYLKVNRCLSDPKPPILLDISTLTGQETKCVDAQYHSGLMKLVVLCRSVKSESENGWLVLLSVTEESNPIVTKIPMVKGSTLDDTAKVKFYNTNYDRDLLGMLIVFNDVYAVDNQSPIPFFQYCMLQKNEELPIDCSPLYFVPLTNLDDFEIYSLIIIPKEIFMLAVGKSSISNGTEVKKCSLWIKEDQSRSLYCSDHKPISISAVDKVTAHMSYPFLIFHNQEKKLVLQCPISMITGDQPNFLESDCINHDLNFVKLDNYFIRSALIQEEIFILALHKKDTKDYFAFCTINLWNREGEYYTSGYMAMVHNSGLLRYKKQQSTVIVRGGPPRISLNNSNCRKSSCLIAIEAIGEGSKAKCYVNLQIVQDPEKEVQIAKEFHDFEVLMPYSANYRWPIQSNLLLGNNLNYEIKLAGVLSQIAEIKIAHNSDAEFLLDPPYLKLEDFMQVIFGDDYIIGLDKNRRVSYYTCYRSGILTFKCKQTLISNSQLFANESLGRHEKFAGNLVAVKLQRKNQERLMIVNPYSDCAFTRVTYKKIYAFAAQFQTIYHSQFKAAFIALSTSDGFQLFRYLVIYNTLEPIEKNLMENFPNDPKYAVTSIHFLRDPVFKKTTLLISNLENNGIVRARFLEITSPYQQIRDIIIPYNFEEVTSCPIKDKIILAGKPQSGQKEIEVLIVSNWVSSKSLQKVALDYLIDDKEKMHKFYCWKDWPLAALITQNPEGKWKTIILYTNGIAMKQVHSVVSDQEFEPVIQQNSLGLVQLSKDSSGLFSKRIAIAEGPLVTANVNGEPSEKAEEDRDNDDFLTDTAYFKLNSQSGKLLDIKPLTVRIFFQGYKLMPYFKSQPKLAEGTFKMDKLIDVRGPVTWVQIFNDKKRLVQYNPRLRGIRKHKAVLVKKPVYGLEFSGGKYLTLARYEDDIFMRNLTFSVFYDEKYKSSITIKVEGPILGFTSHIIDNDHMLIFYIVPADIDSTKYQLKYLIFDPNDENTNRSLFVFNPIATFHNKPLQISSSLNDHSIVVFVRIETKVKLYYLSYNKIRFPDMNWTMFAEHYDCDGLGVASNSQYFILTYFSKHTNKVRLFRYEFTENGPEKVGNGREELFARYMNMWIDCEGISQDYAVCVLNTFSSYLIEIQIDFRSLKSNWRFLAKYGEQEVLSVLVEKNFIVGFSASTYDGKFYKSLQIWKRAIGVWTSSTVKLYSSLELTDPANGDIYLGHPPFSLRTLEENADYDLIVAVGSSNLSMPVEFYRISTDSVTISKDENGKLDISDVIIRYGGLNAVGFNLSSMFSLEKKPVEPPAKTDSWWSKNGQPLMVGIMGTLFVILIMIFLYCCNRSKEVTYEEYIKGLEQMEEDELEHNDNSFKDDLSQRFSSSYRTDGKSRTFTHCTGSMY